MSCCKYDLGNEKIIAGQGALNEIKSELIRLQMKKPLVVTDRGILEAGITGTIGKYLEENEIPYAVYDGVKTDPLDTMVDEGLAMFAKENCGGIVSVGGGSSMDVGKCISIMSVHEGRILDYARSTPGHLDFTKRGCPIISIPTTSGTGSEVSQYAVITNARTHRKTTVASPLILSDSAVLIPEFATKMPQEVTAYTAIDAFSHAIEAYTHRVTIENDVRISDAMAIEAIKLLSANVLTVYQDGSNIQARKDMQWGALLAGVALNIGSGESHALGSMLAKYYGVCHGISVGIPLPYCMEHNIYSAPQRYADVAKALGVDTKGFTAEEAAKAGVAKMKEILRELNFPVMKDYIKDMSEVRKFSEECAGNSCCTSNGRMDNKEAIEAVFFAALQA